MKQFGSSPARLSLFLLFSALLGSRWGTGQELGPVPSPSPTKAECDIRRYELRQQLMDGLAIKKLGALHQLVLDHLSLQDIADLSRAATESKWHLHFEAAKDFMKVGQRILDGKNVFESHTFARLDVADEKMARARYEGPDGQRETILFVKPELQVGVRLGNTSLSQLPAFKNANLVVSTLMDDFSSQPADQHLVVTIKQGQIQSKYLLGELVEKNLAASCQSKDFPYSEDFNSMKPNELIRNRATPKEGAAQTPAELPGSR